MRSAGAPTPRPPSRPSSHGARGDERDGRAVDRGRPGGGWPEGGPALRHGAGEGARRARLFRARQADARQPRHRAGLRPAPLHRVPADLHADQARLPALRQGIGKYALGTQTIALGSMALGGLDVRHIARPAACGRWPRPPTPPWASACATAEHALRRLPARSRRRHLAQPRYRLAHLARPLGDGPGLHRGLLRPGARALYEEIKAYDPLAWPALREGLDRAVEEHRRPAAAPPSASGRAPSRPSRSASIRGRACRRCRSMAAPPPSSPTAAS